jgi:hypothetical protein
MMARSKHRSNLKASYIDAALTFVDLGSPSCNARPGHTFWHERDLGQGPLLLPLLGAKQKTLLLQSITARDPWPI